MLGKDILSVFVAGHRGMVGRAICRALARTHPDIEVLTAGREVVDLRDGKAVSAYLKEKRPDAVVVAAAKVGGILANRDFPAEFIYDNLMIEANLIEGSHRADIQNLLFLGSSCIYPKFADQPMAETSLLTGVLEQTNEPYAVAKIAGIKLCESYARQYGRDYRSVMPTNLYGFFDNFDPEKSHVIPGMMGRFHAAAKAGDAIVTVWGTGRPMREFLFVDDLAEACLHVINLSKAVYEAETQPMLSHLNVGTGVDVTIAELAHTMAKVTGFDGDVVFDASKPDGTPRKLMDVSRLERMGWKAKVGLTEGLKRTYAWYLQNKV
ncbi:MAG: GDP-L-fucose synthase [Pseudomonadota bacterium]